MDQAVNMHFPDIMGKKCVVVVLFCLKTKPSLRQPRDFTGEEIPWQEKEGPGKWSWDPSCGSDLVQDCPWL